MNPALLDPVEAGALVERLSLVRWQLAGYAGLVGAQDAAARGDWLAVAVALSRRRSEASVYGRVAVAAALLAGAPSDLTVLDAARVLAEADGVDLSEWERTAAEGRAAERKAASHPAWLPPPEVATVPVPPPAVACDLSELVTALRGLGLHTAARLVTEGRREYAPTIAEDLGGPRHGSAGSLAVRLNGTRALVCAQVEAWGQGRDEAVLASNAAWRRDDCVTCGHCALAAGDASKHCNSCRAEAAGAVS